MAYRYYSGMVTRDMTLRRRRRSTLLLAGAVLGMSVLSIPLQAQMLGVELPGAPAEALGGACADGVVLDDGTAESGYGWVPSVVDGRYVQTFQTIAFSSRRLQAVCICWTRTRDDVDVDFNVEIYRDTGEGPELDPIASIPASMSDVPEFPDAGFVEVDVSGQVPRLPRPIVHIGVAWDASVDQFFFVCADRSPGTDQVNGHFIDDRAQEWASVLDTNDPIFQEHRAMLIRAQAWPQGVGPVLGWPGVLILSILLAAIGWPLLRKLS